MPPVLVLERPLHPAPRDGRRQRDASAAEEQVTPATDRRGRERDSDDAASSRRAASRQASAESGVFKQARSASLERLGRLRTHPPLLPPPDRVHRVRGESTCNRSKTTRACSTRARNAFSTPKGTGVTAPVSCTAAYPEVATAIIELADRRTDPRSTEPVRDGTPSGGWQHDLLTAPTRASKTGPLVGGGAADDHNIISCEFVRTRVRMLHCYTKRRLCD